MTVHRTDVADVPSRVRARILALTAQVLPDVAPLPGNLRSIATFAPARRARAGGAALWSALADDEFRGHVAVQVVALPEVADAADVAAVAWLDRPEGWLDTFTTAVQAVAAQSQARPDAAADLERVRAQVVALQAQAREERAARRDEERGLRAEIAELRRKVGRARADERSAAERAESAEQARDRALVDADRAVTRAEAEARRLSAELNRALSASSATRREVRAERDAVQTRAWYLLDALVESAVGLRRELGLPAPAGAPADAIEADLVGTQSPRGTRASTVGMLENLLSVPRARLIVDGYNVTKAAWPTATLEAQRSRLVAALSALVARTGAETTVVFDAGESAARPAVPAPRGVRVVFSPLGVIADDVIRRLVDAEPRGRTVVVVTNDREIVVDVERMGARSVVSEVFVEALRTG